MLMIIKCIRVLLLIFSLVGIAFEIKARYKVEWAFIPITTLCFIGVTMFWGGILNFMPIAVLCLCATGLIFFFKNKMLLLEIPQWFSLLHIALFCYLLYYCYDAVYADGDTMTHWGVVLREMCETNRLPNFTTLEVSYQSYPTGTAGLLYYFCKIAWYSEPLALFAQAYFVAASGMAVWAFVKKDRFFQVLGATAFLGFCLHYNVSLDCLQVDNVLSMLCLASICITFFYGEKLLFSIQLNSLLLCFLMIIKNSSGFFLVFSLLFLLPLVIKGHNYLPKFVVLDIFSPILTYLIWLQHTKLVFSDPEHSRHSVSVTAMLEIFHSKSIEEIRTICNSFFSKWFSVNSLHNESGEIQAFWICVAVCFAIFIYKRFQGLDGKSERICALTTVGLYLAYKILLLGMYLFNMPDEDAYGVAAYDRYMRSVTILLYGLAFIRVLMFLREHSPKQPSLNIVARQTVVGVLSALLLIFPILQPQSIYNLKRPDYLQGGFYRRLVQIRNNYSLPSRDGAILVYTTTPFAYFYVQFCFRSPYHTSCADADTFEELVVSNLQNYQYIVIADEDDVVKGVLKENGLPIDQQVIQFY